jgi:hypothetical protein
MLPKRDVRPHDAALEDMLTGVRNAHGYASKQRVKRCLSLRAETQRTATRRIARPQNNDPLGVFLRFHHAECTVAHASNNSRSEQSFGQIGGTLQDRATA